MSAEDMILEAFDYVENKLAELVKEKKKTTQEVDVQLFKKILEEYTDVIKGSVKYEQVYYWLKSLDFEEEVRDWLYGEGYGYDELACYYAECSKGTLKALIQSKEKKKKYLEEELKIIRQHLKWRNK